jgi:hypothetical protein
MAAIVQGQVYNPTGSMAAAMGGGTSGGGGDGTDPSRGKKPSSGHYIDRDEAGKDRARARANQKHSKYLVRNRSDVVSVH